MWTLLVVVVFSREGVQGVVCISASWRVAYLAGVVVSVVGS